MSKKLVTKEYVDKRTILLSKLNQLLTIGSATTLSFSELKNAKGIIIGILKEANYNVSISLLNRDAQFFTIDSQFCYGGCDFSKGTLKITMNSNLTGTFLLTDILIIK